MECPRCRQRLGKRSWTIAQWADRMVSKGGRGCCRTCWGRGPHDDDWVDYLRHIARLDELVLRNLDMRYQRYLAEFVLSVGGDRKAWSYHGVLPLQGHGRLPSTPAIWSTLKCARKQLHICKSCAAGHFPRTSAHWATASNACWRTTPRRRTFKHMASTRQTQPTSSGR